MLRGFAVLLTCQLLGEMLVRAAGWPVPGNVVGMALLLMGLIVGVVQLEWVSEAAELLLTHMALLFVPAGVGVLLYFDLIGREWWPILVATGASTFVVIAVTGHLAQYLEAPHEGEGSGDV